MVHDQEESHHITTHRKRTNPFIQWLNSESPPHSRSSSDTDSQSDPDTESFSAALPSPPLQSSIYTNFKKDLDIFGGSWKKETGGGEGGEEGGGREAEKVRESGEREGGRLYNCCLDRRGKRDPGHQLITISGRREAAHLSHLSHCTIDYTTYIIHCSLCNTINSYTP